MVLIFFEDKNTSKSMFRQAYFPLVIDLDRLIAKVKSAEATIVLFRKKVSMICLTVRMSSLTITITITVPLPLQGLITVIYI